MLFKMLTTLFTMETKTLICILVWGNLFSPILIYSYHTFVKHANNKAILIRMVGIRYLSALGYFLFLFRDIFPDLISVNFANTILYISYFCDIILILKISEILTPRIKSIITGILCAGILVFNVLEFIFHSPSLRISIASAVIFSLYAFPAILLIFKKNIGNFRHSIGFFYVFLLSSLIFRFITSLNSNMGILSDNFGQSIFFLALIMNMINSLVKQLLLIKEDNDRELHELATTDCLTGLLNRRSFLVQSELAFENCIHSGKELSLLFIDIDYFKMANDKYGHQFGDQVLLAFAKFLKSNLRQNDLCCRYGGEEFVILLIDNDTQGKQIANRILEKTQQIVIESVPEYRFTVSMGIASSIPTQDDQLSDYIHNADIAMYHAKQQGRNKLVMYKEHMN